MSDVSKESASRRESTPATDIVQANALVGALGQLPVPWLIMVVLLVVASTVEFQRTAPAMWTLSFHVSTTTIGLAAMLWLPMLLKVIALTGGGMKTAVGEANVGGLLGMMQTASKVLAVRELAKEGGQASEIGQRQDELKLEMEKLGVGREQARKRLESIVREYETIRMTEPGGGPRTLRLEQLMQEIGLLAPSLAFTAEDIMGLFRREGDASRQDVAGWRMVAVRLMAIQPDPTFLDPLLEAIEHRRSRFEQYHALKGLEALVGRSNDEQKARLRVKLGAVVAQGGVDDGSTDKTRVRIADRILSRVGST